MWEIGVILNSVPSVPHQDLQQSLSERSVFNFTFMWPCIVTKCFIINNQPVASNSQIYSGMKLYMFRAVLLPIIRSLFAVQSAMVYVIQVCRELSTRTRMELELSNGMSYRFADSFRAGPGWKWNSVPSWSCSKAVYKPVWHIPVPSVQWINSWWWAEELPETCRVSCRSKFGKLMHLVGFIIQKSVLIFWNKSACMSN